MSGRDCPTPFERPRVFPCPGAVPRLRLCLDVPGDEGSSEAAKPPLGQGVQSMEVAVTCSVGDWEREEVVSGRELRCFLSDRPAYL